MAALMHSAERIIPKQQHLDIFVFLYTWLHIHNPQLIHFVLFHETWVKKLGQVQIFTFYMLFLFHSSLSPLCVTDWVVEYQGRTNKSVSLFTAPLSYSGNLTLVSCQPPHTASHYWPLHISYLITTETRCEEEREESRGSPQTAQTGGSGGRWEVLGKWAAYHCNKPEVWSLNIVRIPLLSSHLSGFLWK